MCKACEAIKNKIGEGFVVTSEEFEFPEALKEALFGFKSAEGRPADAPDLDDEKYKRVPEFIDYVTQTRRHALLCAVRMSEGATDRDNHIAEEAVVDMARTFEDYLRKG